MDPFLPRLVTAAAERHGDKAAFRCDGGELGYATLAERSAQLANALRANGVRPGDLVGILMGKAIENPVAVFGIMAAGAAYVPLDPTAPVGRLVQIARSCDLRHVVVDEGRASRMAKLSEALDEPCFVYGIDGVDEVSTAIGWDEIATGRTTTPWPERAADDPAYLIFTSGSTGTPKGIVHTHGSGSAYASMAAELYGLTADDRLSNFPPLHFDQSTFDFFSGPLVGATTVIIGNEHQLVPASLSQLIEDERLTIWYSVPLALTQLLLYGVLDERDHSSLRWVIYGGEPFPLKHLKALMDIWPQARFSNCYGPAETNQCTFQHLEPLADGAVAADVGVPIGRACPGMETLVIDEDDLPVGAGERGELVVHSPTTMRGYWGRPDLDEAAFLHRPTAAGPRRYYRTGDLVVENDRGLLEFLGRRDRQIKTRGVRVELDEVEAVLSAHDAVEEVAVTTEPGDDGVVIVAYVATTPGVELDAGRLRRHAASRLARPAIPGIVSFVDDFPRTTTGKVDYRALAATGDRT